MYDGERVTLTSKQVQGGVYLLTVVVLVLVVLGTLLRPEERESPFAAYESAVAAASRQPGASEPTMDPELAQGVQMLLGRARLYTSDPSALNKSIGEPVVLRTKESSLRVTPSRVSAGTSVCAAGPLVTVDLLVKPEPGAEALPLSVFHLMGADGADAAPVPACSTGFAEGAEQRTLVFAATEPDRLIVGADPIAPVAVWQLS